MVYICNFREATMGISTLSGKGTLKALPVDGITQIHDIILSFSQPTTTTLSILRK